MNGYADMSHAHKALGGTCAHDMNGMVSEALDYCIYTASLCTYRLQVGRMIPTFSTGMARQRFGTYDLTKSAIYHRKHGSSCSRVLVSFCSFRLGQEF